MLDEERQEAEGSESDPFEAMDAESPDGYEGDSEPETNGQDGESSASPEEPEQAAGGESSTDSDDDAKGDPVDATGILGTDAEDAESATPRFMQGSGAPDRYADFTFPEGFDPSDIGKADMQSLRDDFRSRGLSQDEAQRWIDDVGKSVSVIANGKVKHINGVIDSWWQASKAAGLTGQEFAKPVKAAIDKFDSDGSLHTVVREFGIDRHPAFIRMAAAAGKGLVPSQGTISGGKSRPRRAPEPENPYDAMDSMAPKG